MITILTVDIMADRFMKLIANLDHFSMRPLDDNKAYDSFYESLMRTTPDECAHNVFDAYIHATHDNCEFKTIVTARLRARYALTCDEDITVECLRRVYEARVFARELM